MCRKEVCGSTMTQLRSAYTQLAIEGMITLFMAIGFTRKVAIKEHRKSVREMRKRISRLLKMVPDNQMIVG